MNAPWPEHSSLTRRVWARNRRGDRLIAADGALDLRSAGGQTHLAIAARELRGRTVLIRAERPLSFARTLIELDGLARRIILWPPDLDPVEVPEIAAAGVDLVASEAPCTDVSSSAAWLPIIPPRPREGPAPARRRVTEWVMFTSGTSAAPKMVIHTLAGLTGAIAPWPSNRPPPVWGTFYDVRRYGGLQILLRALVGGGSLALADPGEPMEASLRRFATAGVTRISGTPSHWRLALMNPAIGAISPEYVRLSGEIADQAILDSLKRRFPHAAVAHAFASTEAGVCFEVDDGREGFPASLLDAPAGQVDLRLVGGALHVRSPRTALRYLGQEGRPLRDAAGFVDTGDRVERRGDRCYFLGRASGVINVGGRKVHPEEVERVLNAHPLVRAARAFGRPNALSGQVVAAEIVAPIGRDDEARLRGEILAWCRSRLAPHQTPASLSVSTGVPLSAAGKLAR